MKVGLCESYDKMSTGDKFPALDHTDDRVEKETWKGSPLP